MISEIQQKIFKDKSILILIAVNIYPIIGVFFFHWDYFNIVLLYIIETFIIGLLNVFKMLKAEGTLTPESIEKLGLKIPESDQTAQMQANSGCLKLFIIPFFLVHYNIFVIAQAFFLFTLTSTFELREFNITYFMNFEFISSVMFLLASHIYSFKQNYINKKEYKETPIMILMFLPYKRIFIQQLTVILGAVIIILTQAPFFFLIVLIFVKTIFDLRSHSKIHAIH